MDTIIQYYNGITSMRQMALRNARNCYLARLTTISFIIDISSQFLSPFGCEEHPPWVQKRDGLTPSLFMYSANYQESTSWPSSVTSTWISHWADAFPSFVYTLQSSSPSTNTSSVPSLIIGSIVNIMPGANIMPVPL